MRRQPETVLRLQSAMCCRAHDPPNFRIGPFRFPLERPGDRERSGADDLGDLPLIAQAVGSPAVSLV
jgi:hypothetical protein